MSKLLIYIVATASISASALAQATVKSSSIGAHTIQSPRKRGVASASANPGTMHVIDQAPAPLQWGDSIRSQRNRAIRLIDTGDDQDQSDQVDIVGNAQGRRAGAIGAVSDDNWTGGYQAEAGAGQGGTDARSRRQAMMSQWRAHGHQGVMPDRLVPGQQGDYEATSGWNGGQSGAGAASGTSPVSRSAERSVPLARSRQP